MATTGSRAFVGRVEELGRLRGVLARAAQGRPAVALVAGDAGVGKTRLLAELAAHAEAQGVRVLVGGCMEVGDLGLPYVSFVDAFRDLGARPGEAELAADLAATVPGLGLLLPRHRREPATSANGHGPAAAPTQGPAPTAGVAQPPGEGFERVRLFDGVLSLLVGLAELAPLLLLIEDLHWADRSTRDLVAFLIRTLRTGRVALVGSYRSDELHRRHPLRPLLAELLRVPDLERIELRPFNRRELAQYLAGLEGAPVSAEAVDRILARSEGNPFFAEELVAVGAIRRDVALPEALADVLRDRVEALSDLAQEVLKVAAVAGRRVSHQRLVAAAGLPETEVEAALHEAIAGQVLIADPATESYRFRHALLQEVVYGDLLPGERTRLHATYARLLAAAGDQELEQGVAAELAYHALASHDLPGALAALLRATAEATAMSAPAEAARHLEQALELWDQVPDAAAVTGTDKVGLLLRAAEAANHSGEFRHATKLTRDVIAAIDPATDPLRAAVARDRLSEFLLDYHGSDDDHGEMLEAARRAVELVPADPPAALRARVTGQLGRALAHVHLDDEARRWCNEALAVARKVGSAVDEARALLVCALLAFRHDDVEGARALLDQASARAATSCDRMVELRALYYRGQLEYDTGNLAAAAEAFGQAVAHAERNGLRWSGFGADAGVLRCLACYAAGDWDQAERLSVTVDDRSPAAGGLSAAALLVEVGRGSPAARERFARLRAFFDDRWVAYLAAGAGADLALWDGDLDEARELIRFCLASIAPSEDPWALSAIRPAALGIAAEAERAAQARIAGDEAAVAEATKLGEALLERARAAERKARALGLQVGPEAVAWLARAEAEWTRLQGHADPERWAAAAQAFTFGYVYEEARSRWRLAEALLAEGRREEAEAEARAALQVATRLGAEPLRAELLALARRGRLDLGAAAGAAREEPAAGTLSALTPRELEVLRLVAAGRSNQQIADALFISRKTASVHVSNILGKLGVRTRLEAAAVAHRLRLDLEPA